MSSSTVIIFASSDARTPTGSDRLQNGSASCGGTHADAGAGGGGLRDAGTDTAEALSATCQHASACAAINFGNAIGVNKYEFYEHASLLAVNESKLCYIYAAACMRCACSSAAARAPAMPASSCIIIIIMRAAWRGRSCDAMPHAARDRSAAAAAQSHTWMGGAHAAAPPRRPRRRRSVSTVCASKLILPRPATMPVVRPQPWIWSLEADGRVWSKTVCTRPSVPSCAR